MNLQSRRDFLKKLGLGIGAAIIAPTLLDEAWEQAGGILQRRFYSIPATPTSPPPLAAKLAVSQRELIIAQALDNPEARAALTRAMVEPIKASLMYQVVGRSLLMVEIDDITLLALPRYKSDINDRSHVIPKVSSRELRHKPEFQNTRPFLPRSGW